ncbi:MAG: 23S rRNA (uracil(1939)-C(5))-methyltransferase RlmD [Chitinophagales bacterium]
MWDSLHLPVRNKKRNIELKNVMIEDYAAEGRSLARVDGKVIFIEHAVPGDCVDLVLTRNKKDWAEGRITSFHEYSKERVKPFCAHFGICGGCQWQMLPYERQLHYKQKQVEETLKRIGKVDLPDIMPIVGASKTSHYRNKIEYTFSNKRFLTAEELKNPQIRSTQDSAGFHAKGIFDKVVDIDICHLQEEPSNQMRQAIKNWAIGNRASFYDIKNHQGWLRTMQVRTCTTREIMVNLVFSYEDEGLRKGLLEHVLEQFPQVTSLLYTINPKMNDSLNGLSPQTYYGKGFVIEKMNDFQFKIGPKSFFQTNSLQALKLYEISRDYAELKGNEIVYDLYCGTGSIGIFLSPRAGKVIGVELVPEAIADAKENAELNQIKHAKFIAGDVLDICTNNFFEHEGRPDVIITDPPRAGMHERLVKKILDMEASRIVYVSCNPSTQARDLNLLDNKYRVSRIQPVDMFPHTHHIENLVQLVLRK